MRRLAGEHLVRNGAKRIDVTASIDDSVTCCLLRTHVLRSAERKSSLRDTVAACIAHSERDSEIRYDRLARLHQNVLRLEIAVNHPMRVGVVERVCNGDRNADSLVDRKLLLAIETSAKRLAVDE